MKKFDKNKQPASFAEDGTPLLPDGNPMKRFEVKMRPAEFGKVEQAVFIDNEMLDWSMDVSSLLEAKKMGPEIFKAARKDIEKHFTDSVSEVLNRKVTQDEINHATKTGWI